jgi:ribose-phosphate pyrophosphokinase
MEVDMPTDRGPSLFAVEGTRDYGERVAGHLDLVLGAHEERAFEDGEHKIRPLGEVRRQDVYESRQFRIILHSTWLG